LEAGHTFGVETVKASLLRLGCVDLRSQGIGIGRWAAPANLFHDDERVVVLAGRKIGFGACKHVGRCFGDAEAGVAVEDE
jgi:hypothetical protein